MSGGLVAGRESHNDDGDDDARGGGGGGGGSGFGRRHMIMVVAMIPPWEGEHVDVSSGESNAVRRHSCLQLRYLSSWILETFAIVEAPLAHLPPCLGGSFLSCRKGGVGQI